MYPPIFEQLLISKVHEKHNKIVQDHLVFTWSLPQNQPLFKGTLVDLLDNSI
jgi:hypothetical protein